MQRSLFACCVGISAPILTIPGCTGGSSPSIAESRLVPDAANVAAPGPADRSRNEALTLAEEIQRLERRIEDIRGRKAAATRTAERFRLSIADHAPSAARGTVDEQDFAFWLLPTRNPPDCRGVVDRALAVLAQTPLCAYFRDLRVKDVRLHGDTAFVVYSSATGACTYLRLREARGMWRVVGGKQDLCRRIREAMNR